MTSCGTGSTSPFCVCTDSYGNHVPGYKGMFTYNNKDYGYYCEADMIGFMVTDDTGNTKTLYNGISSTGNKKVLDFAKAFESKYSQGTNQTNNFFSGTTLPYKPNTITTGDDFKAKMPLLFYETLLLYSLLDTMDMPQSINSNTYTCATGERPVYLKYASYFNDRGRDAFVCMTDENIKKPIFFLDPDNAAERTKEEVPYNLYEVLDKDGKACTGSTCDISSTDKFDFDNSPSNYVGGLLFKSRGNIRSEQSFPFASILLLGVIVACFVLYGIYYLYMRQHHKDVISHMNNIKPGAGHRAAARASAAKSANRHPMT